MQELNLTPRQREIINVFEEKNLNFSQELITDKQCGDELHILTHKDENNYLLAQLYVDPRSDFPSEGGQVVLQIDDKLIFGGLENFEKLLGDLNLQENKE